MLYFHSRDFAETFTKNGVKDQILGKPFLDKPVALRKSINLPVNDASSFTVPMSIWNKTGKSNNSV